MSPGIKYIKTHYLKSTLTGPKWQSNNKHKNVTHIFLSKHRDFGRLFFDILAKGSRMATYIWVNTGSDNGVLPDDTKPLPESMLTCH